MKTPRGISALAAIALAATGVVGLTSSAHAVGTSLPVISDAQVIGGLTHSLVKDDVAVVSVQVRMVCSGGCDAMHLFALPIYLDVQHSTSTPAAPLRWVPDSGYDTGEPNFVRVSGNRDDGVYRASAVFTSGQNGSYVFGRIGFAGLGWGYFPLAASARTVVISGADPIILRPKIDPGAIRPGTSTPTKVAFLVQTAGSGRARGGAEVLVCIDPCGYLGVNAPTQTLVTDVNGLTSWFPHVSRGGAGYATLVRTITVDGTPLVFRTASASVYPTSQPTPSVTWANIKSSTTSIAAGGLLTLSGSVGGNGSPTRPDTVFVQRWVGGKWNTLGRSLLRANGGWSYVTTPRSTGVNQYRVVKPTNACSGNVCLSPNATSGAVRVTVR